MKKKLLFDLAGKAAKQYGARWAKKAGNKGVSVASDIARRKGLTDKHHDLDSLYSELQAKYKRGELNKEELNKVKSQIQKAWKERYKR